MEPERKPESESEALPLKFAYTFLLNNGLSADSDEIKKSRDRLGSYTSSLRRAKIVALLQQHNLLESFIKTSWRFGLTTEGKRKLDAYERIYAKFKKASDSEGYTLDSTSDEEIEAGAKFALEEQLRDYLAENLGILEQGLSLWPVENGDAVEFKVDERGPSRRIDILAKDREGSPVVVELKVSRGHEKTVGQALYYRARVKRLFSAQRVRIFIVASEISPELKAAASEVPEVFLFEYSLAVKVTAVST